MRTKNEEVRASFLRARATMCVIRMMTPGGVVDDDGQRPQSKLFRADPESQSMNRPSRLSPNTSAQRPALNRMRISDNHRTRCAARYARRSRPYIVAITADTKREVELAVLRDVIPPSFKRTEIDSS